MLALSLITALLAAGDAPVYAVVVGYNGGTDGREGRALPTLRFADDDAIRFYRWFRGVTDERNVWLLTEPDEQTRSDNPTIHSFARSPTRRVLLEVLDELKSRVRGKSARVYFVYAGHGLSGRFLLKPEVSDEAAFTGAELRTAFAQVEAELSLLFLDACRSQSLFTERGTKEWADEALALERAAQQQPLGILTATSSTQSAGEAVSLRGGFFSHVLASGLAGAADADSDGFVRFGELAAFVAFHTEAMFEQRPWFEAPSGDLSAPVFEVSGRAGLKLTPDIQGHLKVFSLPEKQLVVELNKAAGRALQLALPAGRYSVESDASRVEVEVLKQPVLVSSPQFLAVATRGGEERLGFEHAFTTDVVNALSAGYQAGAQPSSPRPSKHSIDALYMMNFLPLGVSAVGYGAELGYRASLGRLWASARGIFSWAPVAGVGLGRAGGMALGGVSLQVGPVSIQPHLGIGLTAVWRTASGATRADLTAPLGVFGLRGEFPLSRWLSVSLEGRGEVTFLSLDGNRTPFLSPSVGLGVAWKN